METKDYYEGTASIKKRIEQIKKRKKTARNDFIKLAKFVGMSEEAIKDSLRELDGDN